MKPIEKLPRKLLDCEELEEVGWPAAFERIGTATRIDYMTQIHAGEWEPYVHEFDSGVSVYAPVSAGRFGEIPVGTQLDEAVRPILMGVADRLFFDMRDRDQVIFHRRGLGVDEPDVAASVHVGEMSEPMMAWDHEGHQLLVLDGDGSVRFVLRDGFLALDHDAKIAG